MKRLTLTIIIIALIILLIPFLIGLNYENAVRTQLDELNQNSEVNFEIQEYNLSWFSSSARIKLLIKTKRTGHLPIVLNKTINHGPFLWRNRRLVFGLANSIIKLELSEAVNDYLQQVSGEATEAVNIRTETDFDFNTSIDIGVNPIKVKDPYFNLDIKGVEASLTFLSQSSISNSSVFSFYVDGFELLEKRGSTSLSLNNFNVHFSQSLAKGEKYTPTAIYDTVAEVELSKLHFNGPSSNENITLKDVELFISSRLDDNEDIVDSNFRADIKHIDLKALGQAFDYFSTDISLNRIDAAVIQEINQLLSQDNSKSIDLMAELQRLLPKLASKDPYLNFEHLDISSQAGSAYSYLNANIDNDQLNSGNIVSLMYALDLEAYASVPKALVNSFVLPEDTQELIDKNFLIEHEADQLETSFTFSNGQAKVNDQFIPLGDFLPIK
jgi:uncharacterized protein YdgA (DUF945 family)